MAYQTKDSGKRVDYPSGMRRDTANGKPRYDLIWLPGLKRFAELLERGADKYGDNNWQLADSPEELARFRASAWRHFTQYMAGECDEDHMAAVMFNLFACEYVTDRIGENKALDDDVRRGLTEPDELTRLLHPKPLSDALDG